MEMCGELVTNSLHDLWDSEKIFDSCKHEGHILACTKHLGDERGEDSLVS